MAEFVEVQMRDDGVNAVAILQVKSRPDQAKAAELECLPTIARLAREGFLSLLITTDVILEAWCRPRSYPSAIPTSLLAGVERRSLLPALRRGLFFPGDFPRNDRPLCDFVEWLIKIFRPGTLPKSIFSKMTDQEKENLQNLDTLRNICRSLDYKHYADAFHLWSCEAAGNTNFLTCDKKFLNALSANKQLVLRSSAMTPSALLNELDVLERDKLPFEYSKVYSLSGRLLD
jgi:hypothetical protein